MQTSSGKLPLGYLFGKLLLGNLYVKLLLSIHVIHVTLILDDSDIVSDT